MDQSEILFLQRAHPSDDQPLNYLEVCQTAKKHDLYADKDVPDFKGNDDKSGKIYDGTKISSMLQWNPKFKNFEDFIIKDCENQFNVACIKKFMKDISQDAISIATAFVALRHFGVGKILKAQIL